MRLVGIVFPLEDQPEDKRGEHGGEGIDFTLHSREPKGVGEGVYQ
jgi:hypothetical protein